MTSAYNNRRWAGEGCKDGAEGLEWPEEVSELKGEKEMEQDKEHLRLLSIFHYVVGVIAALFALFPIIHFVIGLVMVFAPEIFESEGGEPPPAFFGWFFVIFAGMFIMTGWVLAGLIITAGRFLSSRRHRMFCLVVAGVECIFMPFGTVLGVFTIIVLMRESVKEMFSAGRDIQPTF